MYVYKLLKLKLILWGDNNVADTDNPLRIPVHSIRSIPLSAGRAANPLLLRNPT